MQRDLFGETGQVQTDGRRGLGELQRKVAVAGGVHAVRRGCVEEEFAGGEGAVECERCAGDRTGAERAQVHAPACIGKAAAIAKDHLDIGEKPVRDKHRFGALQVRVAGHDRVAAGLGK